MTDTTDWTLLPLDPGGTVIVKGIPIHQRADGKILVPRDTPFLSREQLILDEKTPIRRPRRSTTRSSCSPWTRPAPPPITTP